jgi:hypothetical protein
MAKTTQEIETKTKLSVSSKIALSFMIATCIVLAGSMIFSAAYLAVVNIFKAPQTTTTKNLNSVNQDQTFETKT